MLRSQHSSHVASVVRFQLHGQGPSLRLYPAIGSGGEGGEDAEGGSMVMSADGSRLWWAIWERAAYYEEVNI